MKLPAGVILMINPRDDIPEGWKDSGVAVIPYTPPRSTGNVSVVYNLSVRLIEKEEDDEASSPDSPVSSR